jgi:hypothetical protein
MAAGCASFFQDCRAGSGDEFQVVQQLLTFANPMEWYDVKQVESYIRPVLKQVDKIADGRFVQPCIANGNQYFSFHMCQSFVSRGNAFYVSIDCGLALNADNFLQE